MNKKCLRKDSEAIKLISKAVQYCIFREKIFSRPFTQVYRSELAMKAMAENHKGFCGNL